MFDEWRERRRKKREKDEEISEIIGAGKDHEGHGQLGREQDVPEDGWIIAQRGQMPGI